MNETEVIVEVGAEGGSLALYGFRTEGGWSFRREVTDWTPELIDEERIHKKTAAVNSWEAALALLDQYPWLKLSPIRVHPDFRERIWVAVQERLDSSSEISKSELNRWREFCRVR